MGTIARVFEELQSRRRLKISKRIRWLGLNVNLKGLIKKAPLGAFYLAPPAPGSRWRGKGEDQEEWAIGPFFVLASRGLSQRVNKERLIALLEPTVRALGYELVDLDARTGGQGLLRVYIDCDPGVTLSDCELVSEQLGAFLDVEDPLPGRYVLEISSPGLDRRLRTLAHFRRFAQQDVKIELKEAREGRRRLKGRLAGVVDDEVVVDVDGEEWRLALEDIATARLVPEF